MHNHFDDQAASWDEDESKIERARTIADAIVESLRLNGDERVLEYGAGTGLVAQALGERVGELTLADSSSGMRAAMTNKIETGTLPAATRVWDLDLSTDEVPRGESFDLIASSLVLHHIGELDRVLEGFWSLLRSGGSVAIADLDREDGSFHEHLHDFDGHNGFDRDELRTRLQEAGFVDVRFDDCGEVHKAGRSFGLFLATARRP